MTAQTLLMLIAVLVLALLLAYLLWWLMSRELGFGKDIKKLAQECGQSDVYNVPLVLLFGATAECSERLCQQSWHLQPVSEPRELGRWWRGQLGGVMAFAEKPGKDESQSSWTSLVDALVRCRPRRPIDAAIWVIDAKVLEDADAAGQLGVLVKTRLSALFHRTGWTIPVYVLIDGCERIPQLSELARHLPPRALDNPLGWASAFSPEMAYRNDWVDIAVEQITQGLTRTAFAVSALEVSSGRDRLGSDVFRVGEKLNAWRAPLMAMLDPVFRSATPSTAHCLRGLFLTCAPATQKEGAGQPASWSLFAARLLTDRFWAEEGLAQPAMRLLTNRSRLFKTVSASMLGVSIVWLLALLIWGPNTADAKHLAETFKAWRMHATRLDMGEDERRERLKDFMSAMQAVPHWTLSSWLLPLSKITPIDNDVEARLTSAFEQQFLTSASVLLTNQLSLHSRPNPPCVDSGNGSNDSDLKDLLFFLDHLERDEKQVNAYNDLLRPGGGSMKSVYEMTTFLAKVQVDQATATDLSPVERAIQNATWAGHSSNLDGSGAIALVQFKPQASRKFECLVKKWAEPLYFPPQLKSLKQEVLPLLEKLRDRPAGDVQKSTVLIEIRQALHALALELTAINEARQGVSDSDAGQTEMNLYARAGKLQLIGEDQARTIKANIQESRRQFQKVRLTNNHQSSTDGLIAVSPSGMSLSVDMAAFLSALDGIIEQGNLLLPAANTPVCDRQAEVTNEAVDAAIDRYDKRLRMATGLLPLVPDAYRGSTKNWLASNTVWAIETDLYPCNRARAGKVALPLEIKAQRLAALQKGADKLARYLTDLERVDLAQALIADVTGQSQALLVSAANSLSVYETSMDGFESWQGKAGTGYQIFGLATAEELPAFQAAQVEQIESTVTALSDSLNWISAHASGASSSSNQILQDWLAINSELFRHKAKSPASALLALEKLVKNDVQEMDLSNCRQRLEKIAPVKGDNVFAKRQRQLLQQAWSRCGVLRLTQAAAAYAEVSHSFNQWLANFFPFSSSQAAAPALPINVQTFLRLFDSRVDAINIGLSDVSNKRADDAKRFIQGVARMRKWLVPLLPVREGESPGGVALQVNWRTNRGNEIGGDQLIEWTLSAGEQAQRYPGANKADIRWYAGQPVSLAFRWAANSQASPGAPKENSDALFVVNGKQALWAADGPWALFQLFRQFQIEAGSMNLSGHGMPLGASIPTNDQSKSYVTRVFFQINAVSEVDGTKELLPPPVFPMGPAPMTPFGIRAGNSTMEGVSNAR
jgi:type VI secretion system protein ImpL